MERKVPHAKSNLCMMKNTIKNRNGQNEPIVLEISD